MSVKIRLQRHGKKANHFTGLSQTHVLKETENTLKNQVLIIQIQPSNNRN